MSTVTLDGLTKRFGAAVTAVDHVSLDVEAGQVVGLLGPNGAGKTTTLRMLVGLIRPTSGEARLFGERVHPGVPALRRVGAIVEGPGFVPHRTGLDNLSMWWRAGGAKLADADLDRVLDIAGLGDAVHRKVKTYSHGMRGRLALAQALLGRPELLVLDEPTNGLDPQQMKEVRELVRRLAAEGVTVLLSSHLLDEVQQVCSHVAVLDEGRLVAAGPVESLLRAESAVYLEVDDRETATAVLRGLTGVRRVSVEDAGLLLELDGVRRSEVVAALVHARVGVETVTDRRLEDAFLELFHREAP